MLVSLVCCRAASAAMLPSSSLKPSPAPYSTKVRLMLPTAIYTCLSMPASLGLYCTATLIWSAIFQLFYMYSPITYSELFLHNYDPILHVTIHALHVMMLTLFWFDNQECSGQLTCISIDSFSVKSKAIYSCWN